MSIEEIKARHEKGEEVYALRSFMSNATRSQAHQDRGELIRMVEDAQKKYENCVGDLMKCGEELETEQARVAELQSQVDSLSKSVDYWRDLCEGERS